MTSRRINGAGRDGGGGESWGGVRTDVPSPPLPSLGARLVPSSKPRLGAGGIPPFASAACLGWEGEINNANKRHERNTFGSRYGFRVSCFSCLGLVNRLEVSPEPTVQMGCGRVYLGVCGGVGIQKPASAPRGKKKKKKLFHLLRWPRWPVKTHFIPPWPPLPSRCGVQWLVFPDRVISWACLLRTS